MTAAGSDPVPAQSIASSADGQWIAVRRGREVALLAAAGGPPVGMLGLDSDDIDVALVGPPTVLVTIARAPAPRVTLYQPPYLDAVAHCDLDGPAHLAAITGPRLAVVSRDGKHVTIVRTASRGLSTQAVDPGSQVEFAVGLERNQLLFGLLRKLEVWDAASGRPVLRLQLQLPPPPRTVGAAQGHLWVTRPGSDEVFIYRLSDGRPFRHYVGAPVQDVICHPASPLIVIVTARGLVRLHCFAHSVSVIDAPWTPGEPLAQLAVGEDICLLGLGDEPEPWRVPIAGAGAPTVTPDPAQASEPVFETAADKQRASRERTPSSAAPSGTGGSTGGTGSAGATDTGAHDPWSAPAAATDSALRPATASTRNRAWREPLVAYGTELARSASGVDMPVVAVDTELGALAHRLGLSATARRTLVTLYSLYLNGEPAMPIARLAQLLGDWAEPLGQGELAGLAMLRRKHGKVALRRAVTDLLDGAAPRAIRLAGTGTAAPRPGAFRLARDGRSDADLERELAAQLGRIAIVDGDPDRAILEARLHAAAAVAFQPPEHRPRPWPRGASLVLVLYGSASSWIADLPALEPPAPAP